MAHKTFISYKYSESQEKRDEIIEALGADTTYYRGETSESPDRTDQKTETIKKVLSDQLHGTSVTIVILSPNLRQSDWVEWEVKYSLKETTREDKCSRTNGVLAILPKDIRLSENQIPQIILENRYNKKGATRNRDNKNIESDSDLNASYISFVSYSDFLSNPNKYIENAYDKSQNCASYDIVKEPAKRTVTGASIKPMKPWRM